MLLARIGSLCGSGERLRTGPRLFAILANFKQHRVRLRQVAKALNDQGLRFGMEYVGPKTSWSRSRYPFIHTTAEIKERG
jgi:hypothetical protein